MYKKYTNFKNSCIKELKQNIPKCLPVPQMISVQKNNISSCYITEFNMSLDIFDTNLFPIGEKLVLSKLIFFLKNEFNDYNLNRNFLEPNNTSMLSAHLSIGVISLRQCINLLLKIHPHVINFLENYFWINELLWREFYQHLLYCYPELGQGKSFCSWQQNIQWNKNLDYFNVWKNGKTGYPIIDAAMRQLKKIGWVHNRLRMLTANFLVKNLLINWKKGEQYFMSQLIDGDFASNNGNWQWISSVGTDSVPYFRTFNPILQSKKIDKYAKFILQYIPESKNTPLKQIHSLGYSNILHDINYKYPTPIVNYYYSKQKALLLFKNAKYKK